MGLGFVTLMLLNAALFVLGEILRPKNAPPNAKPGRVTPPTAETGSPVPVVFGTCKLSCNVIWYGIPQTIAVRTRVRTGIFSRKWVTTGHQYVVPMATAICHGCVDELLDIYFGDFKLTVYGATAMTPPLPMVRGDNVAATINAPNLFGGTTMEGGVQGNIEVNFGTDTQLAPTFFDDPTMPWYNPFYTVPPSPLKGIAYVIWKNVTMGMSPYLKPIFFVVRRCPTCLTQSDDIANVNGDANPAEVVYEILTHQIWGLGIPTNLIDVSSFVQCAYDLKAEDTGFSMAFTDQQLGSEMLEEVLRHCNMVLYEHPLTGLIKLRLIRNDYTVSTLRVVTNEEAHNIEFSRSTWRETFNEIKLRYVLRDPDFQPEVAQSQNLASMQAIHEVKPVTHDYPGISRPVQAQREAELLMRMSSLPLAKVTFDMDRTGADLEIGEPFIVQFPELDVDQLVVRATKIDYGRLDDGKINVTAIEDIFDVSGIAYAPPPAVGGGDDTIENTPDTIYLQTALEAPYALSGASHDVEIMAARPTGLYTGYEVWEGGVTDLGDQLAFTPHGRFELAYGMATAAVDPTGFIVDRTRDMDTAAASGLLYTQAGEIMRYTAITALGGGRYRLSGIERGLMDTVPMDHAAGNMIWVLDVAFTDSGRTLLDSLSYKLLPYNSLGVLPLANAIAMPITIDGRYLNPAPPGNVKLNGAGYDAWPDVLDTEDAVLTWSHRNFSEQGVGAPYELQSVAGSYTLVGTLTIQLREVGGGLIAEWTGQTGTTVSYTAVERDNDDLAFVLNVYWRIIPVDGARTGTVRDTPPFLLYTAQP